MTNRAPVLAESPKVVKVQRRREVLADAAVATLRERGFAHTSLRDIAENSPLTHGVVHYYFADKWDLLAFAVLRQKESCAKRYDEAIADARTPQEVRAAFASAMRHTLESESQMHRVWYDMRAQSLYEPKLREATCAIDALLQDMIWRVVTWYQCATGPEAELLIDPFIAYATFDGIFENSLTRYFAGDADAPARLERMAADQLGRMVSCPSTRTA